MPTFFDEYVLCRMTISTTASESHSDIPSGSDHALSVSGTFLAEVTPTRLQAETGSAAPRLVPRREFFAGGEQSINSLLTELSIPWPPQHLIESLTSMLSEASRWVARNPRAAEARLLTLEISVLAGQSRTIERESLEVALRESEAFADRLPGFGAVPADDEAIEALPLAEHGEECDQGVCCVCLENFNDDDSDDDDEEEDQDRTVVKMPCSHYYHKSCIAPWLKTSNLCPLCRASMPISSSCPEIKETIEVDDGRDIIFNF